MGESLPSIRGGGETMPEIVKSGFQVSPSGKVSHNSKL